MKDIENYVNTNKRVVNGTGPTDAKIVIVGDSPNAEEVRGGKPFTSSAGRLLKKLLFRAKIIDETCYMTNVIKEHPPNGRVESFINLSSKNITHKESYDNYVNLLKEEIKEINPNVVVAVGNVALYALTGETGITSWRGSIMESSLIPGLKVIPTIHPAMAIRNFMYQYYIFNDLQRVYEQSQFVYIKKTRRDYITDPVLDQIHDYLDKCLEQKGTDNLVGYDTEVGGYKHGLSEISCISFSYDRKSAICIPFTKSGKPRWSPQNEQGIWDKIALILNDPEIKKVAQNKFFDTHMIFRRYGIVVKNCEDTMIAHAIAFPDFPKGLDFITSTQTDIGYYKADGKEWFGGAGNEENFWVYNAKDSIVLTEAFPKLEQILKDQGNWETYKAQNELVESLVFMSEHGMKIDVEGLTTKSAETLKRIEELEEEFQEMAGREINLRSHKQLKEYFYGSKSSGGLGLPPYKNNKGKPTTDEKALTRLSRPIQARDAVPEARLLLEHRKLAKMNGTYFEMSYDDDGRVRSSMNPVGTRTGRLSSSQNIFGTGANLQNQPYEMKKYFLVDTDHIAYEIDLSQAENRIVAYVAPEPRLIEAFENGIDIHSRTASYIFGKHEDDISNEQGSAPQFGTGDQSERFWGKKANHAFNYGQSANAFSQQMLISVGEAQQIYNAYHNAYPGVVKYHRMIKNSLNKDRTLTNLFGRRYRFLDRWNYSLFLAAYAFIPQSTIADIINRRGLIRIYNNLPEVKLLNQIHDSVVFEIPTSVPYRRHAEIVKQIMTWLSEPVTWNERTFSIPCEAKILTETLMSGPEISNNEELCLDELTELIKAEHEKVLQKK